jgi:hypothetical protein
MIGRVVVKVHSLFGKSAILSTTLTRVMFIIIMAKNNNNMERINAHIKKREKKEKK